MTKPASMSGLLPAKGSATRWSRYPVTHHFLHQRSPRFGPSLHGWCASR